MWRRSDHCARQMQVLPGDVHDVDLAATLLFDRRAVSTLIRWEFAAPSRDSSAGTFRRPSFAISTFESTSLQPSADQGNRDRRYPFAPASTNPRRAPQNPPYAILEHNPKKCTKLYLHAQRSHIACPSSIHIYHQDGVALLKWRRGRQIATPSSITASTTITTTRGTLRLSTTSDTFQRNIEPTLTARDRPSRPRFLRRPSSSRSSLLLHLNHQPLLTDLSASK